MKKLAAVATDGILVLPLRGGEAVVAEPAAVLYRTGGVKSSWVAQGANWMVRTMGRLQRRRAGLADSLLRLEGPGEVGLGRWANGSVQGVELAASERLVADPECVMALADTMKVTIVLDQAFQRRQRRMVLVALEGPGRALLQARGSASTVILEPGEQLDARAGGIAWFSGTVDFELRHGSAGPRRWPKKPQGFVARMTGPGEVTVQLDG